ncbi:MAG: hypothetical protein FJY88_06565 [Candidatus Eisenbacteria bacterium]|nr:hypothetical protein [Candidatus Eisenbacteria bacterium]
MWEKIVGWVKALFGGKITAQIGKWNRALSGSSGGDQSPVLTAGRDIHVSLTGSVGPQAASVAELEATIPDLLDELRGHVTDNPLIRDIIVLNTKANAYNWPDAHVRFTADEDPRIWNQIRILVNRGLASEVKSRFAYRMSEDLVHYLRKG